MKLPLPPGPQAPAPQLRISPGASHLRARSGLRATRGACTGCLLDLGCWAAGLVVTWGRAMRISHSDGIKMDLYGFSTIIYYHEVAKLMLFRIYGTMRIQPIMNPSPKKLKTQPFCGPKCMVSSPAKRYGFLSGVPCGGGPHYTFFHMEVS